MFKRALVRKPGRSLLRGISGAGLGPPDYARAQEQHQQYIAALEQCGLQVEILPPEESFPDSTFVEDTAILTENCAVIARPGVPARQGEEEKVAPFISRYYSNIENIEAPATLEGGDVLQVKNHFFVGLSCRSNEEGFRQLNRILTGYGYSCSAIKLQELLHLKTAVAYLYPHKLLVAGELIRQEFGPELEKIQVAEEESYSANCIWVNGRVLMPAGFSVTREKIEAAGYQVLTVDVSEFRKLDGGLSCLSLRF